MPDRHRVPPPESAARTLRGAGIEAKGQPHKEGAQRKGSKRSIRKAGIQAQRDAMLEAGFVPHEGHGADGSYYGPDGQPLIKGEHKHRPAPDYWEEDIRQAESYARQEGKGAYGAAMYSSKPGTGKKSERYMLIRLRNWPGIAERLGAGPT